MKEYCQNCIHRQLDTGECLKIEEHISIECNWNELIEQGDLRAMLEEKYDVDELLDHLYEFFQKNLKANYTVEGVTEFRCNYYK